MDAIDLDAKRDTEGQGTVILCSIIITIYQVISFSSLSCNKLSISSWHFLRCSGCLARFRRAKLMADEVVSCPEDLKERKTKSFLLYLGKLGMEGQESTIKLTRSVQPAKRNVSTSSLISQSVIPFPFSSLARSKISRKSKYFFFGSASLSS